MILPARFCSLLDLDQTCSVMNVEFCKATQSVEVNLPFLLPESPNFSSASQRAPTDAIEKGIWMNPGSTPVLIRDFAYNEITSVTGQQLEPIPRQTAWKTQRTNIESHQVPNDGTHQSVREILLPDARRAEESGVGHNSKIDIENALAKAGIGGPYRVDRVFDVPSILLAANPVQSSPSQRHEREAAGRSGRSDLGPDRSMAATPDGINNQVETAATLINHGNSFGPPEHTRKGGDCIASRQAYDCSDSGPLSSRRIRTSYNVRPVQPHLTETQDLSILETGKDEKGPKAWLIDSSAISRGLASEVIRTTSASRSSDLLAHASTFKRPDTPRPVPVNIHQNVEGRIESPRRVRNSTTTYQDWSYTPPSVSRIEDSAIEFSTDAEMLDVDDFISSPSCQLRSSSPPIKDSESLYKSGSMLPPPSPSKISSGDAAIKRHVFRHSNLRTQISFQQEVSATRTLGSPAQTVKPPRPAPHPHFREPLPKPPPIPSDHEPHAPRMVKREHRSRRKSTALSTSSKTSKTKGRAVTCGAVDGKRAGRDRRATSATMTNFGSRPKQKQNQRVIAERAVVEELGAAV